MEDDVYYVIGLGGLDDWDAGRGSLYWIEDRNGEHALPVFMTPEDARSYWTANSGVRERLEMADTTPTTHHGPLLENRVTLLPLDEEGVAWAAEMVGADYLIRGLLPGAEQEILRLR
jgi:hypothetical protein